ncbi:hypothetical protein GW17_00014160 [Ensete ventricosum]|nr:hypothetical protein GW17_00014160 [Ensete ventricosum]
MYCSVLEIRHFCIEHSGTPFKSFKSKRLWLDGFQKLSSILSAKELSDLQEVMRDKELNLRTDVYEILLQDEVPA